MQEEPSLPSQPAAPPPRPHGAVDLGAGAWIGRDDLRWSFSRSGGPGGQNVNKVNTKATLRLDYAALRGLPEAAVERLRAATAGRRSSEGDLQLVGDLGRSQVDNREACLEQLRALVSQALVVPKRRRKTRPTRGSKERRLDSKRRTGEKKQSRRWRGE